MATVEGKKVKKKVIAKIDSDLSINLFSLTGDISSVLPIPKKLFETKKNTVLLAQYIRVYLLNQRQGNASTKTRSEVVGSTRKIYKQKGTGRARHGSVKAPIFVGGGIVGGPKPRDFSASFNKSMRQIAIATALTMKHEEKKVIGLADAFLEMKPKTKDIVSLMKKLKLNNKRVLLVLNNMDNNLFLSTKNISNIEVISTQLINAYAVSKADTVIFVEKSVAELTKHFVTA